MELSNGPMETVTLVASKRTCVMEREATTTFVEISILEIGSPTREADKPHIPITTEESLKESSGVMNEKDPDHSNGQLEISSLEHGDLEDDLDLDD